MHRFAVAVSANTSIKSVEKLMKVNKIQLIPVIEAGRLIGIVEEKDIKKFKGDKSESIRRIMSSPLFVCSEEDIDQAAKVMLEMHITRLPVVNSKEEMLFLGMVTSTDIANAIKMGVE
jgi:CBS domain-containing protein